MITFVVLCMVIAIAIIALGCLVIGALGSAPLWLLFAIASPFVIIDVFFIWLFTRQKKDQDK